MSGTFQHPVQRRDEGGPAPALRPVALWPTRTLTNVSILSAGALTAASFGATLTAFTAQSTLQDVVAGAPAPDVLAYDAFSLIYSLVGLVALVATCFWLWRARGNTERIRPHFRHERSRVWIWLGWWVPIVSFWFPRQVVRDIHRASSPTLAPPPGLDLWWALWLGGVLLSQLADRIALSGELEHVTMLGPLNAASTVLMTGAFVLWARIVRAVVRLQDAAVVA